MFTSIRLRIRELTLNDTKNFYKILTDPEVNEFIPLEDFDNYQSNKLLKSIINDKNMINRTRYFFAIETLDTANFIGSTVFKMNSLGTATLGYSIFKPFWGQGYATEASKLMISYGFTELNINKIESTCIPVNKASEKILIKCNMKLLRINKNNILLNGIRYNEHCYSIDRFSMDL